MNWFSTKYFFWRFLVIILGAVIFLVYLKLIYNILPSMHLTSSIQLQSNNTMILSINQKAKTKYILQYHTTGKRTICLGDKFKGCEYSSCVFTREFNLMPIEQFDAILFHEPQVNSNEKPPHNRSLFQKYIFFSHESPISFPIVYKDGGFYNLTITYRRDSDIYFPYCEVNKHNIEPNFSRELLLDKVKNKTKLIAWVVSNCKRQGTENRKRLYQDINKYIHVDVYGACGNLTCPGRMSNECYGILDTNYKFYLAFENSFCKDYVTEKLFFVLNKTDVVPIVFGFNEYDKLAPPHSYINVDDFKSAKDLTDYLLFLDTHPEEYIQYFEWKKTFWIKDGAVLLKEMCCNLCKKLHEPLTYTRYESMQKWAMGNDNSVCPKYKYKWS